MNTRDSLNDLPRNALESEHDFASFITQRIKILAAFAGSILGK
ncbi:MAG: hypothetical protein WAU25_01605 [Nitrososphaeraceae archaeon]|jgi:hypothetical protein